MGQESSHCLKICVSVCKRFRTQTGPSHRSQATLRDEALHLQQLVTLQNASRSLDMEKGPKLGLSFPKRSPIPRETLGNANVAFPPLHAAFSP